MTHRPVSPGARLRGRDRSLDWKFRRAMDGRGEYRSTDVPFERFPWWAAGVLHAQRNEWVMFGFARGGRVEFVWLNEGEPTRVMPHLSVDRICEAARAQGFDTLVDVHNHPNDDPQSFDASRPSAQDLHSVGLLGDATNAWGIALVAIVCEAGVPSSMPTGRCATGARGNSCSHCCRAS